MHSVIRTNTEEGGDERKVRENGEGVITFLVTRFPSSSVNCSSVTESSGMFLASSPWRMLKGSKNERRKGD